MLVRVFLEGNREKARRVLDCATKAEVEAALIDLVDGLIQLDDDGEAPDGTPLTEEDHDAILSVLETMMALGTSGRKPVKR